MEQEKYLVILAHGYGADGHDLLSLAPDLRAVLPDAVIHAPNAPQVCGMGNGGYQWFALERFDHGELVSGLRQAQDGFQTMLLAVLQEYAISPANLVLLGFSQGAMMALYAGLRLPVAPRAILAFSGLLPETEELPISVSAPVFLAHGGMDPIVPVAALEATKSILQRSKIVVETCLTPEGGHNIAPQAWQNALIFLRNQITN